MDFQFKMFWRTYFFFTLLNISAVLKLTRHKQTIKETDKQIQRYILISRARGTAMTVSANEFASDPCSQVLYIHHFYF